MRRCTASWRKFGLGSAKPLAAASGLKTKTISAPPSDESLSRSILGPRNLPGQHRLFGSEAEPQCTSGNGRIMQGERK